MINILKRTSLQISAATVAGYLVSTGPAQASSGNNFGKIAENITTSIADVPGLLSGVAYMFGILLGVLGILKIKDHVENPSQTHLKDGAVRLAAGGALFALPMVYDAMQATIGSGGNVQGATLNKVNFGVH